MAVDAVPQFLPLGLSAPFPVAQGPSSTFIDAWRLLTTRLCPHFLYVQLFSALNERTLTSQQLLNTIHS